MSEPLNDLIDPRTIGIGSILAKARDDGIYDRRIDGFYRVIIDSQAMLHVSTKVLNHDICPARHLEKQVSSPR